MSGETVSKSGQGYTMPAVPDVDYVTVSALATAMAGRMATPSGTTAQYIRGDGTLATLPVIQRVRVQTDSSGNYTWTYPVAYGAGVVPVVSAISESASSTVPQGVQIVGVPTNTACVFKVINLPSTSVLSIVVLGAPTGAQAYLHLTVQSP